MTTSKDDQALDFEKFSMLEKQVSIKHSEVLGNIAQGFEFSASLSNYLFKERGQTYFYPVSYYVSRVMSKENEDDRKADFESLFLVKLILDSLQNTYDWEDFLNMAEILDIELCKGVNLTWGNCGY